MNKNINMLLGQALDKAVPDTWSYLTSDQVERVVEIFADLLIKECADVCERFGESGDGYTCSAEILEHFGVQE